MKDDQGVVQIWLISPNGGTPRQLTHNSWSIASTFTWSADGQYLAQIMDNSVFITDSSTGTGTRLTIRSADDDAPRPEACVFSPDGRRIAYVRRVPRGAGVYNQIFSVELP
jgi:Tol biopolymer transport system component